MHQSTVSPPSTSHVVALAQISTIEKEEAGGKSFFINGPLPASMCDLAGPLAQAHVIPLASPAVNGFG
jgi:hypothetical protein